MSTVTGVRSLIRDELAGELGVEFVDGKLEGPVERQDIGCVWAEGAQEQEDNVLYQWVTIMARVFLNYTMNRRGTRPLDPLPLEDLAERIQLSLRDKQATEFGCEQLTVTGYGIDHERQAVEVTIMVNMLNPFSLI